MGVRTIKTNREYNIEHLIHLVREVEELKDRLQPEDTGHLYTSINVLENRISEIKVELSIFNNN